MVRETLTSETFTERMKEVIVKWPLYKQLLFSGSITRTHVSSATAPFPGGRTSEYALLPDEVETYCSVCRRDQRWKLIEPTGVYSGAVFRMDRVYVEVRFVCRNCERRTHTYFFFVSVGKNDGVIVKVGQHPALEREPSEVLRSAMEESDVVLYKHALTCRNSNFGIAAVAYLRRIVENRINYLLDLIADQVSVLEPESLLLAKVSEMKGEKRFSEKIEYAAELLPTSLRRGGQNPIAMLHDLTSDGLHARSDDECIEIFDRCQLAFEHVIRRLKLDRVEDAAYETALMRLAERASKRK
jgi:hypothetical protein